VLAVNFVAKNGRIIRLGDIAHVTRGPADQAQPMFRVNGRQGIGLAIAMRNGGDVLALGRNVEQAMAEITAKLPVGIESILVADQPVTVDHAVDDFMEALWEAIAIVLAVSLVSLGLRAGAVVAISIPLVLAAVFMAMMVCGIGFQRISLGAIIIALGLLVDDAMITIEAMVTRLERQVESDALLPIAPQRMVPTRQQRRHAVGRRGPSQAQPVDVVAVRQSRRADRGILVLDRPDAHVVRRRLGAGEPGHAKRWISAAF
jgi:multidrug efflux pump subunit AcrB